MCDMLGFDFYEIGIHDGSKEITDYEFVAFDECAVIEKRLPAASSKTWGVQYSMSLDAQFAIFDNPNFEAPASNELQVNKFKTYRILPRFIGLNDNFDLP